MNLHRINKNFGIKFFKHPNNLNYNIFNFFFRKKIKKKIDNDLVKNYHNLGYIKLNINDFELANYLSNRINEKDAKKKIYLSNEHSIYFEADEEMKEKIRNQISNNFGEIIEKLKKYYLNDIAVVNVEIKRNHGLKDSGYYELKNRLKENEFYNMYYHCDYYTMNYFKLFINLQDITTEHGPLTFYNIEETRNFVSQSDFKDRNNYQNIELKSEIKNCGQIGDSLIINTSLCIHKAGIPKYKNHRDVLCVTFVATPEKINDLFYYEKNYPGDIWNLEKRVAKKFSKPKNLRNTYKLYKELTNNFKNF